MKEYLKPDVEIVEFTVESIATTGIISGDDDSDL